MLRTYLLNPDSKFTVCLEGAGGVGGLLAIEHAGGGSSTWDIRHVHYNGNVIALTNSTGNISARYRYSPFGETITSVDLDSSGWNARNIHRFSTKPEVAGTGLLYYGYRYYDPVTGRWPSRDPIEEEGGINLYGFLGNNGTNTSDYLGNISNNLPPPNNRTVWECKVEFGEAACTITVWIDGGEGGCFDVGCGTSPANTGIGKDISKPKAIGIAL